MDVYNKPDEKDSGHRSKSDLKNGKLSNKKPSDETNGGTSSNEGISKKKKNPVKRNVW